MKIKLRNTNTHRAPVSDIPALLQTNTQQGLTIDQVLERKQRYGANEIIEEKESNLFQGILHQLSNPLAIILLVAFALTILLHEYIDAAVILVATIINVAISLYQEHRAGNAFRALSQSRSHEAVVIRGGNQHLVSTQDLVPGDMVVLRAGDYVPADGRLIDTNRLAINQVMFTGESEAVIKNTETNDEPRPFDRENMAFMGSTVVTGSGVMTVTTTGMGTQFGTIAERLGSIEKDLSPIQRSMKQIAFVLGVVTVIALVLVLVLGLYQGKDFYTTLLLAVAVGVSAVPEGLLSAVTVVLAFGAREIMRKGGLVKNLSSAETLGSADYILTDKTGTLTYGVMKTEGWFTLNNADATVLQEYAALSCDVFYDRESKKYVGDEMDTALSEAVYETVADFDMVQMTHQLVDAIPFDSAYRFYANLREHEDGHSLYLKGAPGMLLDSVTAVLDGGKVRDITDADRDHFRTILKDQAHEGRRLLAVCVRHGVDEQVFESAWDGNGVASVPAGLTFVGLVSFYDRVRSSVPAVIGSMRQSGTKVIMVTGDSADTAHRIALESGVISDEREAVYAGSDIDDFTDEHLLEIMQSNQARIFARVTPDHKLRLATILQSQGHVVAMTGDGVNDAPALQKATIGISLSSSTEVAKEAADLVLVDDSFDTIAYAIAEGRRMMLNLKKTVIYLLSTSFSEVLVLLGSLAVAGPVPFYPTQILWANIIEEGLMNFAFIFEPNNDKQSDNDQILGSHTRNMVIGIGAVNGAILLAFYFILLQWNISDDMLRTYMFAALSIDSVFLGIALKSLYNPIWRVKLFSNMYLVFSSIVSLALLFVALHLPFLQHVLHLEPLSMVGMEIVFAFACINLLGVEIVKKLCR